MLQWRKFNFFDLQKNVDDGKVAEALKVKCEMEKEKVNVYRTKLL